MREKTEAVEVASLQMRLKIPCQQKVPWLRKMENRNTGGTI